MESELIEVNEVSLVKYDDKNFEYTDKEKELCFYFQVCEPDEITIIVFDDLLPPEKSLEASYGNFFVETLEEGVETTKEITKANVNEFIMWR